MDSKIPLYISAVALFVAVLASLFFFNEIQKLKKSLKDSKITKNEISVIHGRFDVVDSTLDEHTQSISRLKHFVTVEKIVEPEKEEIGQELPDETLVVEDIDDEDIEVESLDSDDEN